MTSGEIICLRNEPSADSHASRRAFAPGRFEIVREEAPTLPEPTAPLLRKQAKDCGCVAFFARLMIWATRNSL